MTSLQHQHQQQADMSTSSLRLQEVETQPQQAQKAIRTSPSVTNIYSRYRLPSTTTTATTNSGDSINSILMDDPITSMDHKRSYTIESLSSLAYFTSDGPASSELTPSAAIRDRYYQSNRYLSSSENLSIYDKEEELLEEEEEDILYNEEKIDGDVFVYRPGDSQYYSKPAQQTPSIYSTNDSVYSLRTEYNLNDDNRSIGSIRTVDDRLQGRSSATTNNILQKTAKKVSRSSSIFRHVGGGGKDKDKEPKKKLQPFMPIRENKITMDNSSIRTAGGTSLLSKLSKSTAPMRAKLSAISGLTRNSRIDTLSNNNNSSFNSLLLPGRKRMAESVYNMPISSPSPIIPQQKQQKPQPISTVATTATRKVVEKAQSFIMMPKTLSASSSTSSMVMPTVLVEEPNSLKDNLVIYPALLSKVAEAFRERIVTHTRSKDSIKYKDVFDGKEAVDKLAFIIKSNDRNLALLLGRALDAQKFFHDVNYEHRLRDSAQELYQFRDHHLNMRPKSGVLVTTDSTSDFNVFLNSKEEGEATAAEKEDDSTPNGVFTLLTDCYSPTCSRDQLCYSARCPRRQEQQKRQKNGHQRGESHSYLMTHSQQEEEERLWINTVPKTILDKLTKDEKKRQENIFELIYTEKDFVNDLTYLKEQWIDPLLSENSEVTLTDPSSLVNAIFWNMMEVLDVNSTLSHNLLERQSKNKVVDQIGDIMLAHVAKFEPFVRYGAHQIIGKYAFENEKSTNPSFADFVTKTERLPQSRKLELNGYLTKPTTRLGRYNLLLREILKHTPKEHPDQETIPRVMTIIAKFLADVNRETGKTENSFNLQLLNERLINKHISNFDLDLAASNRQVIMKGTWKKGSGSESSDVLVYLLDHCLLIIKPKQNEEKYKLYRKPIPLALLSITFPDHTKRASTIIPLGRPSNVANTGSSESSINVSGATITSSDNNNILANIPKSGYPISFVHLGKQSSGGPLTLYSTTLAGRKQWAEKIEGQRRALVEKHKVFNIQPINESFFSTFNKVNCIAVFENGKSLVLGGDQGVYLKKEGSGDELIRILAMDKVSQIDILEQSNLILVLADKILYTYSLDTLLSTETGIKRGRKISSHVSFFKVGKIIDKNAVLPAEGGDATIVQQQVGEGVEKTLVCFVRYNAMTSTIRALEPCETTESKKKNKKNFGRLIGNKNEALKAYKDLYIPGEASSIQFFKNIICVGSARGFQMVNLSSAEVQSVLDPNDESNNSILALHENMKPISMFRHKDGNILLCYSELAFYIDKKGKRVRKDWSISWEGNPTAFSFRFPYVVAFNTNFIEVRHMDTGDLLQVIPGNNIRCLRPDSTDRIHGVMDDRLAGSEVIFELKLVDPHRRKISMIKNNRNKKLE